MTSVLEEAQQIIHGARRADYGHPYDDFTRVGRIWAALLDIPEIPPEKVALMLGGLKMARLCSNPGHRDSNLDWSGYSGTYELVRERRTAKGNGHAAAVNPAIAVAAVTQPDGFA